MPINAEVRAEIKRMLDIKADTGRTYRDELRTAFKASQTNVSGIPREVASKHSVLAKKEGVYTETLSAVLRFVGVLENDSMIRQILLADKKKSTALLAAEAEAAAAASRVTYLTEQERICIALQTSGVTFDELVKTITEDVQSSTPTRLPLRTAAVAGTASLLTAGGIMAALATTGAMPAAIAAFGLIALGPIAPLALAAIVLVIAIAAAVVIVVGIGLKTSRGTFSLSSKKDYTPNAEVEPSHQATHSGRPPQSNSEHHASPTQTATDERKRPNRHHHKRETPSADTTSRPKLEL